MMLDFSSGSLVLLIAWFLIFIVKARVGNKIKNWDKN
jgi:hypothetical protein